MNPRERIAHALADELRTHGVDAHASGAGVHWKVDAKGTAARTADVSCFWYEASDAAFQLGMNRANDRSRLAASRATYEGPEYLVTLRDGDRSVADGRCRTTEKDVVGAIRTWLSGDELDAVVRVAPFIDALRRKALAVAETLAPSLRREIGTDPSYELWVYGGDRSCEVQAASDGLACAFFLGQAQVGLGTTTDRVSDAVSAWLVERLPLASMTSRVPWLVLERHAELLETNPARWHWMHLLERVEDARDVLAPLRDLVVALSARPMVTAFYSFSSLFRLCFSASSHYPWVNDGLPIVWRGQDGTYVVDGKPYDLPGAADEIERGLRAANVRPIFGSWPHHGQPIVDAWLAQAGSSLRSSLVQRKGRWYDLEIRTDDEARRCRVSDTTVEFIEAGVGRYRTFDGFEAAMNAIVRFLERRTPSDTR